MSEMRFRVSAVDRSNHTARLLDKRHPVGTPSHYPEVYAQVKPLLVGSIVDLPRDFARFPVDTCVICGAAVPEGLHACPECEHRILQSADMPIQRPAIPAPGVICRLQLLFRKLCHRLYV